MGHRKPQPIKLRNLLSNDAVPDCQVAQPRGSFDRLRANGAIHAR